ncbi:MAG: DUF2064 domain-containing protein [Maribacter sp.]
MQVINEHKTAILIFALSSKEELKCKKIHGAKELFASLSRHTHNTVKKTKLPYFHFTEKEQHGNSFGERFTNAIKSVYDLGFEQIITIGNDSPHLQATQLLETAITLSKNNAVLGPSKDGGFYLMGLHKVNFNPKVFKNLPWQTSLLMNSLKMELLSNTIELVSLNTLHDIDHLGDLNTIIKYTIGLPLQIIRAIQSIVLSNSILFQIEVPFVGFFQSEIQQNRGSPMLHLA